MLRLLMNKHVLLRSVLRITAPALCIAAAGCVLRAVHAGGADEAARAARHAYNVKAAAAYSYRFGASRSRFCPRTPRPIPASLLTRRAFPRRSIAGIATRPRTSSGGSRRTPTPTVRAWYQRNVNLMKAEKGVEYMRHCEGCHDPIALLAGNSRRASPRRIPMTRTASRAASATPSRR